MERYETAKMDIIEFEAEDIITTSNCKYYAGGLCMPDDGCTECEDEEWE